MICGFAADETARLPELPLEPLTKALDKGGLEALNSHLDGGGNWPRITTDSFAAKEGISRQEELVLLSDRLLGLLRDRAKAAAPANLKEVKDEAALLFSLGDKLWQAGGYRNLALALLCSEFASCRCGEIVILTRGEDMGPARPATFKVRNADDMLSLFVREVPEVALLANTGLKETLEKTPVTGDSWLEMLVAIGEIELNGSTVGERFYETLVFRMRPLGAIISREDLASLVIHQGWACVIHESLLPALSMYLKNKGSLEQLKIDPTNERKFEDVMKSGVFRFSTKPVLQGLVDVGRLAAFVDDLQSPGGIAKRLFGPNQG